MCEPMKAYQEPVPRSKEAAAAVFACQSMRMLAMGGTACAKRARACQLNPLLGPGATICSECPAGAARMRLLLGSKGIAAAAVALARVTSHPGGPLADGVCARCKARPSRNDGTGYQAMCLKCKREGERTVLAARAARGVVGTRGLIEEILVWARETAVTDAPQVAPRRREIVRAEKAKLPRRFPPCAECGRKRSVVGQARIDAGLGHLCGICAREEVKTYELVDRDGDCTCGRPLGRMRAGRDNPELCTECHGRVYALAQGRKRKARERAAAKEAA